MPLSEKQASIVVTSKTKARLESKKHLYHKRNMSDTINELIDRAEKYQKLMNEHADIQFEKARKYKKMMDEKEAV